MNEVTKRGRGTRRSRLLIGVGAALALSLTVLAGSASAIVQRPFTAEFGPDGLPSSNFSAGAGGLRIAMQQANDHLYTYPMAGPEPGVRAFDLSTPGTQTPLGAPFPIATHSPGFVGGFTVDNSSTATAARIYESNGDGFVQDNLWAWSPAGTPLGAPFPLKPQEPGRFCNVAVDSKGNLAVSDLNSLAVQAGRGVHRYTANGVELPMINTGKEMFGQPCAVAFGQNDDLFVSSNNGSEVRKYTASSNYTESVEFSDISASSIAIDKSTGTVFTSGADNLISEFASDGTLLRRFGVTYEIYFGDFASIAVDEDTNVVYAANSRSPQSVQIFGPPVALPDVSTDRPRNVTGAGALFVGEVDPAGAPDVTDCFFEYGNGQEYEIGEVPCEPAVSPGQPIDDVTEVTAQVAGLNPGSEYHFRLVVETANGIEVGDDEEMFAVGAPALSKEATVLEVTSETAQLTSEINPFGVISSYHYEFGPEECDVSECAVSRTIEMQTCVLLFCSNPPNEDTPAPIEITGLQPGTDYFFRLVGENNQNGVSKGPEFTFATFPLDPAGVDPCENAHERKQTEAAKLRRCRAYELVSASDQGGYDVTSNLVPGLEPLDAHPEADDAFLYTLSDGKVPGIGGFPVNFGTDPYVARRGPNGWESTYEGIPATAPSINPFASTLTDADSILESFAFAEPDRCDPCFGDGSVGIPIRLPDGDLVQGMKGSIDVALPEPAGDIAEHFSADGSHFAFGSEQKFTDAGHAGALTIYDRNLATDTTQVVSTMPDGSTMTGDVDQLDISADGSRVLLGRPVGADPEGNVLYDLYMHIGTDADSVEVANTAAGVLYSGMTDDGTMVYFTTGDVPAGTDDTDTSADLFRADVGSSSASVTRVSTGSGGTGNEDGCVTPEKWNVAAGGPEDCSIVAVAGGGGVASGDGTVYFVSPERLDGAENGVQDQPNVYVAEPGEAPEFVGMLDNSLIKPPPTPPKRQHLGDFGTPPISQARGLAVDQATGDVYVAEQGSGGRITRFTSGGGAQNFSEGPGAGTHRFNQSSPAGNGVDTIDVDRAPGSPFNGAFYVREGTTKVNVYANSGKKLGELTGFSSVCGLAVDQANGDVYVSDLGYVGVRRFSPIAATPEPVSNANYEEEVIKTPGLNACAVAVDTQNAVYVSQNNTGPMRKYEKTSFGSPGSPPEPLGDEFTTIARAVTTDPKNDWVYVNEGTQITVFRPDGSLVQSYGVGNITNSWAVAINKDSGHSYATNANNAIKRFGYEDIPFVEVEHPWLTHGIQEAAVRNSEDFQVTPDGDHAVFTSRLKLTEEDTDNRLQVYHYGHDEGQIHCTSCKPTEAIMTTDAFLTSGSGNNLSDDGRVYFTTPEQLTLRDTNRRTDAYEWEDGTIALISTGKNIFNSALASVDSTGKNVYFYTRQSIAPQDDNGQVMKVYTARELGGYAYLPDPLPCQAADECRGPGTQVAPPPGIGTYRGEGGNVTVTTTKAKKKRTCRKGFVKKRGKCVKKKRKHRKRGRRNHRGGRRG